LSASAFGVWSVCNHLPDAPTHFFVWAAGDVFNNHELFAPSIPLRQKETRHFCRVGESIFCQIFAHITLAAAPVIAHSLAASSESMNFPNDAATLTTCRQMYRPAIGIDEDFVSVLARATIVTVRCIRK